MGRLLLVDDSEAILEFERSVLSAHHVLTTARNGVEALMRAAQVRPDAILLDLSMPVMSGDEALRRLRADPELHDVPVLVVSSERTREEEVRTLGADGFLPKPVRAEVLVSEVERILAAARERVRTRSLQILPLRVGPLRFALTLAPVRHILDQVRTHPLPGGPPYLDAFLELRERAVPVLDLAARLDVTHAAALVDRKLVVLEDGRAWLALCVDSVGDPEELPPERLTASDRLGDAGAGLGGWVVAIAQRDEGALAVLDGTSLVPADVLQSLPQLLADLERAG